MDDVVQNIFDDIEIFSCSLQELCALTTASLLESSDHVTTEKVGDLQEYSNSQSQHPLQSHLDHSTTLSASNSSIVNFSASNTLIASPENVAHVGETAKEALEPSSNSLLNSTSEGETFGTSRTEEKTQDLFIYNLIDDSFREKILPSDLEQLKKISIIRHSPNSNSTYVWRSKNLQTYEEGGRVGILDSGKGRKSNWHAPFFGFQTTDDFVKSNKGNLMFNLF